MLHETIQRYLKWSEQRGTALATLKATRSDQFDIVRVEMDGDTVTLDVEITDRGYPWATETYVAEVSDGKLQSLALTAFNLQL